MIIYKNTSLLHSDAEALVNTVNMVGIMGKGIALQFKEYFPLNFKLYQKACKTGNVAIGKMFVTETGQFTGTKYIINFPTKKDWRINTKLEYIEDGLDDLLRVIKDKNIQSIAIPPLGCGNGGLDWKDVKPLIEKKLAPISAKINIEVYEPGHHAYAKTTVKAEAPRLNKIRALVLTLADRYTVLGFDISHLEIQKLAYFLQEMGQKDLKLRFEKGVYGPYALNLKHLLAYLEGHYFKGQIRFQDMKPTAALQLVTDYLPEVNSIIQNDLTDEEKTRLHNLTHFIEGFESPLGLELLATVHWAMKETGNNASADSIKSYIAAWSSRKDELMTLPQIILAKNKIQQYFA